MDNAVSHLDATIADLEGRRDALTVMIDQLKMLREGGMPAFGPGGASPSSGSGQLTEQAIPHDAFFQMTIPDAVKKYLGIAKKTKSVPQIAEALMAGGLKSSAQFFPATVRAVIAKDGRFVRVNGEWGMSEWYPAMRKDKKTKPAKRKRKAKNKASKPPRAAPPKNTNESGGAKSSAPLNENGQPSLRTRIVGYLNAHPTQSFKPIAIATALSAPEKATAARLSELAKKGTVVNGPDGYKILKTS